MGNLNQRRYSPCKVRASYEGLGVLRGINKIKVYIIRKHNQMTPDFTKLHDSHEFWNLARKLLALGYNMLF